MNNRNSRNVSFYFRPIPALLNNDDVGKLACLHFYTAYEKLKSLERRTGIVYHTPKQFDSKRKQIIYALGYGEKRGKGALKKYSDEDIVFYHVIFEMASYKGFSYDETIKMIGDPPEMIRKILDIGRKLDPVLRDSIAKKNKSFIEESFNFLIEKRRN